MKKVQFQAELQRSFSPYLPHWKKYLKKALYRKTEDFVQWLVFDTVGYKTAVRPWYSIQVLAVQLPTIDLTLGGIIRSRDGFDSWLTPQVWENDAADVITHIINHIKPNAMEPLNVGSIEVLLREQFLSSDHFNAWIASGIAAIVQQEYERGYMLLGQARHVLSQVNQPWAVADTSRLDKWLKCPPETILDTLRIDARRNSEELGIG
ncbi:MAG: hypothetical protein K1X50_19800 [Candidatus Promineofilum sp.]|nr:hypothetical protein [Promineifilum sp.]